MKKIFGIFVSIIFYLSFINMTIACEFLKEQIGTSISNLTEKYDLLDDPSDADSQDLTLVKEYDSMSFCDDIEFCLLYTSPSPRDSMTSRMPSSA